MINHALCGNSKVCTAVEKLIKLFSESTMLYYAIKYKVKFIDKILSKMYQCLPLTGEEIVIFNINFYDTVISECLVSQL